VTAMCAWSDAWIPPEPRQPPEVAPDGAAPGSRLTRTAKDRRAKPHDNVELE
jgi:hypothetical protein